MVSYFACCYDARFGDELRAAGASVQWLGPVRTSHPWTIWSARQRLRDVLSQTAPDAVICHMPWNHAVFGPEVRRSRRPLVFWAHGVTGGGYLARWAGATRPDLAVCSSRFTACSLNRLFPDVSKSVVYPPVEMPEQSAGAGSFLRRRLDISDESVVIVQVSRMEALKGHSLHLQALEKLKDVPGWVSVIVGGPQRPSETAYLESLQRQAARAGISDRIRFLGQRDDVHEILSISDIFCQPNEEPEGFGIVFIEALRAGLPVVTTRIGATEEILTGAEGYLVPPRDPGALAASLQDLITSPAKRRALGQTGPARAQTLCDVASQLDCLHRALAQVTPHPQSALVGHKTTGANPDTKSA